MKLNSFPAGVFLCEECGRKHRVDIKLVEENALEDLPVFFRKLCGENKKVVIISDEITWETAGEKCHDVLKTEYHILPLILYPDGERKVTAKEQYLRHIESKARSADVLLTVGSGTISDLGKLAASALGKPVICFPTAPSMNGYTSPVAAYIKNGLKLTIPVKPAMGVSYDMEILGDSPADLIKSGFADSLAKSFANADWKISSCLTGENYCPLPYKMTSQSEKRYIDCGKELVAKQNLKAVRALMEALNIGGISMMIAGKSSPASGGEHLISHFLDMYAHIYRGEIFAYHGLQVGAGVFFSSLLYDWIKGLTAEEIKTLIKNTNINYERHLNKLSSLFPACTETIKAEFEIKMRQIGVLRETLPEKWDEIRSDIANMIYAPERIKDLLKQAEVKHHLRELDVNEELMYDALVLSRFIRGRLTVLDIAGEAGMLERFAKKYIEEM